MGGRSFSRRSHRPHSIRARREYFAPSAGQRNHRAPMNEGETEAIYEVRLTTDADHLNEARELLAAQLETASYPLRKIEVVEHDPETVEVVATLLGTSANRDELERVVAALGSAAITRHATWSLRTVE